MAFNIDQYEGAGTENINVSSLPLLSIIQKSSPQVDSTHPNYATKKLEGAKPGDIMFNADSSILSQPLHFVVLATVTLYAEWKPKNLGGGLVAHHGLDVVSNPAYRRGPKGVKKEENKEYLGQHDLRQTIYLSVMLLNDGKWVPALFALTSSQLKGGRNLLKKLLSVKTPSGGKAPTFFSKWLATTVLERNADNEAYFAWTFTHNGVFDLTADEAVLQLAAESGPLAQEALPKSGPISPRALPAPAAKTPALAAPANADDDQAF